MIEAPTTTHRSVVIQDFARSELFDRTFQEGMDLVEETAGYLDGSGRQESKLLSRNAALAYAAESMRLTTRLMQVASWLLVQRAVREGDMPAENACDERYRLGGEAVSRVAETPEDLPPGSPACWTAPSASMSASVTWTAACTWKIPRWRPRTRWPRNSTACGAPSGAKAPVELRRDCRQRKTPRVSPRRF